MFRKKFEISLKTNTAGRVGVTIKIIQKFKIFIT